MSHREKGGVDGIMENINKAKNEEGDLVFSMFITTKTGKRIYRKNGRPFCFRAKNK